MTCKQCNGVGRVKKYRKKLNGQVVLAEVRCKACLGTGIQPEKKRKKSDLHHELWLWFSKFVRLSAADAITGLAKCYTCGKSLPILERNTKGWSLNGWLHAGHFFHGKLDFDPRNVKNQCNTCNLHKSGCHNEYAINLERDYYPGILQELKTDSCSYTETKKRDYTEEYYLEQIQAYKEKVSNLKHYFVNLFETKN